VARISIVFGGLLIALGIGAFVGTGNEHPTALIPAGLGLVLGLLGIVALNPSRRKHAMHAAAMVGLVGVVGGGIRLLQPIIQGTEIKLPVAYGCTAAMVVLCLVFVGLCVNSFIQARRQRTMAGSE